MFTRVILKMIKQAELASICMLMGRNMKVDGKMICNVAMGMKFGQIILNTQDPT